MSNNDILTTVAISELLNNKKDEELDTPTVVAISELLNNKKKFNNINDDTEISKIKKQNSQTDAQTYAQKDVIYSLNNSMSEKLKALGFYIQILSNNNKNNNDIKDKIKK